MTSSAANRCLDRRVCRERSFEGEAAQCMLQICTTTLHYDARPLSMTLTSGPREILAMNPVAVCCRHKREIARWAERINAAASSPVRDEDVMLKKRTFAARTACFSSWL